MESGQVGPIKTNPVHWIFFFPGLVFQFCIIILLLLQCTHRVHVSNPFDTEMTVRSLSPSVAHPPSFGISRNSRISAVTLIRSSSSASSTMEEQQPKRVVVCGGGVIGVCTAYFLAKKGAAVTLIEKSSVACAASGKAGGFLAFDWCDGGAVSKLARASFNLHRSLAQELDGPRSYGYRPLDTISLSINEEQRHSAGSTPSSNPAVPSWVDRPCRNPRTIGTTATTAQVHPQLFTRTLLSAAVDKHGVEVVIGKMESVEVEGGRVVSVALQGGRVVGAEAVVLTLGPWSSRLPLLSSLFGVSGLKAHSIVLEPKEPDAITPHALFLSYYPSHGGEPMDPEVYPRPTGNITLNFSFASVRLYGKWYSIMLLML